MECAAQWARVFSGWEAFGRTVLGDRLLDFLFSFEIGVMQLALCCFSVLVAGSLSARRMLNRSCQCSPCGSR